jgi:oligoendopeptidase F
VRSSHRRLFWFLIVTLATSAAALLTLSGCGPKYDIQTVRSRADEMSRRIMEAYYDTDAYGTELDAAGIVSEYSDLSDPGLARFVGSLRGREREPRLRKQLDYLYYDVVGTVVWNALAERTDEIANTEAAGIVTVDGEDVPYRELGNRLFNETDSAKRQSYYLATGQFAVEKTNPLRAEVVDEEREGLSAFGFEDLGDYEEQRRGVSLDSLDANIASFLEATDDIYLELTDSASREIFDRPVTEIEDYDRGRLFRGEEFDVYFPADQAVPLLEGTLSGMGIDLDQLPVITLDDEDRPEKEPRPASYPIVPGEDVRILVKPVGGSYDYESLFHEMGHALHDAYVAVPEYEFQRLGDYGTTETYAYILEDLLSNPAFIVDNGLITDKSVLRRFLTNQLLSDLGSARYYGGLLRYERLLHAGNLTDEQLMDAYGEIMARSRLVPLEHPEFGYLADNEDFYGVNYLEAWFLAAQLRAALTERFGERWWTQKAAGDFLEDLWSYGAELSPDEVARKLGYDGLDSSYYINEVRNAYAASRGVSP